MHLVFWIPGHFRAETFDLFYIAIKSNASSIILI